MLITVFFTFGISMDAWVKSGLFEREIDIYKKLSNQYNFKFQFVTFGDEKDYTILAKEKNLFVLPVYSLIKRPKSKIFRYIQSILIPIYLRKELKNSDLFKTNQLWGGWIPLLGKMLFKKKFIVRCGYEFYSFQKREKSNFFYITLVKLISKSIYKSADLILVSSENDKKIITKTFKITSDKIKIFPNWVNCEIFKPKIQTSYDNKVIAVGRLEKQKNYENLIKSLKDTEISLDIVGNGTLKNSLKNLAKENNVKLNFLGNYPNYQMPKLLTKYKIYVISSEFEGTPKTLLEAMSCGLNVIGANVTGIKELIINNENGILILNSENDYKKNINMIFSNNKLSKKLSTNARKYILKNHSLKNAIEIEKKIYFSLINHI